MPARREILKKQRKCYSAPFLTHFDTPKHILVQVDTPPYGLGAVMAHTMKDRSEKPVHYISRTLFDAERKYPRFEKEGPVFLREKTIPVFVWE